MKLNSVKRVALSAALFGLVGVATSQAVPVDPEKLSETLVLFIPTLKISKKKLITVSITVAIVSVKVA